MKKRNKIVIGMGIACLLSLPLFIHDREQAIKISDAYNKFGVSAKYANVTGKKFVEIMCTFKNAGKLQNTNSNFGISAIIENILFNKVGDLSYNEMNNALVKYGFTQLSTDASGDDIVIKMRIAKSHVIDGLKFIVPAIMSPKFSEQDLERAKNCVFTAFSSNAVRTLLLVEATLFKSLFPDHLYGEIIDGFATNIANIKRQDISDFISKNFTHKKCELFICGDVSTSDVSNYINILCESMPKGTEVKESSFETKMSHDKITIIKHAGLQNMAWVAIGIRLDNLSMEEHAGLKILSDAYFDSCRSVFMKLLIKQNIVCNYYAKLVDTRQYSTVLCIYSLMYLRDVEKYLTVVTDGFAHLRYNPAIDALHQSKQFFLERKNTGIGELSGVYDVIKAINLPHDIVNNSTFKAISNKIFNPDNVRIIIVIDEDKRVDLNKSKFYTQSVQKNRINHKK